MPAESPIHRAPVGGEYYVFRDPIHNLIEIDDEQEGQLLRRILQTREVQRLRFIAQNGLGNFVYPGLEGSRFPHSLGAYYVARTLIRSLKDRQPPENESFPSSLRIENRDAISFPIAALLHDLGHGPLSHVWEQYLAPAGTENHHEQRTLQILRSDQTEIGHLLNRGLADAFPEFRFLPEDVTNFLQGTHRLYYLLPLLSGNLDVDRLDFIARDTRNAGVTYGFHDLDWIIRTFRFARLRPELVRKEDKSFLAPFWTIAIDGRKGLNTLVQFLHARENMYSLVYLHKTIRAASLMFKNLFLRAAQLTSRGIPFPCVDPHMLIVFKGEPLGVQEYVQLDDNIIWTQVKLWARDGNDRILSDLSRRLLNRSFYKVFTVSANTFALLQRFDQNGGHLNAMVQARLGVDQDSSKYYYGFDQAEFNKVGKEREGAHNAVWILEEGIGAHKFTSLHEYWRDRHEELATNYYYFMVDPKCLDEANVIVERLRHAEDQGYSLEEIEVPRSHRLLTTLGREGEWKSVYLGAAANPGDDQGSIVALKCYKHSDEAAEAIRRDVNQVNILLDNVEGSDFLSKAKFLGSANGRAWLSERVWSSSLYDLVVNAGPFRDLAEITRLARDLAAGLRALHSRNLRHTDIKPENCGVIRRGGTVHRYVLGDFGCISPSPEERPEDPRLEGTQRTRAPEVFQNQEFSLASDVWSLGATLYSVCRLRYPFMDFDAPHGTEAERTARAVAIGEDVENLVASFLVDCRDNLPPAIFRMLEGCFAQKGERWTAQELFDHCEAAHRDTALLEGRYAWQRADDVLSHVALVPGLSFGKEQDRFRRHSEYIPPSVLHQLGVI